MAYEGLSELRAAWEEYAYKSGIYYLPHTIEQSMHGAHNLVITMTGDQRHQATHRKTKGQKRSSSAVGGRGILFFRMVKK